MSHTCYQHLKLVETIYQWGGAYSYESLTIQRCRECGQLWKLRAQWDAGTGNDSILIRPGESQRGYTFTVEEAAKYEAVQP